MLIPLTINANPTITPGETKPQLVSEEDFASPVWSSDGGFVPIGDVVAYKPSVQPLSAFCGQSEH